MSRGHKGRCFRQRRRTKARKESKGERFDYPIRYKVPRALMPFLFGAFANQVRAQFEQMGQAIRRYNDHAAKVGKPGVRAEGQPEPDAAPAPG